ncbi:glutathione-dependent formaldehyde-activating enzyme [Hypoxylon sp. NC0597]|nr:glutathione-dependent formaldehyde-activating enzyme [Hypoxylon sp. NC0597]
MAEELKTYRGNCHCAAYVYEVDLPKELKPTKCNCSSCYRKAVLWVIPKEKENLRFIKGDMNSLTSYTFGQKTFDHKFCPTCGVQLFAVGHMEPPQPGEEKEPLTGVNVRTFQHGQVDVWKIETEQVDGKSFRGSYEAPKFTGPEPKAEIEGGKLYTGSCHCGAVRVALKSKPLDKSSTEKIVECNCSICNRHGVVWLYPKKDQVVIEGEENLTTYLFNSMLWGKTFCKICGVPIHNKCEPITEEELNAMPEDRRNFIKGGQALTPINLRIFNDLNVEDLNVVQFDGYNKNLPMYVEP